MRRTRAQFKEAASALETDSPAPVTIPVSGAGEDEALGQPGASRSRALTARVRGRRYVARHAVPLEWWLMAPAMLTAVVIHGCASWSLPPVASGFAAMVAALVALIAPLAARYERQRRVTARERWALAGAVVVLPMLLFGGAMSWWIVHGALRGWQTGPAAMVVIGTLVAILCSGRLPTMVAALLALWFAHAVITLEPATMLALVIGAGSGVYISSRQIELNRAAQARQEQIERAQQRAELILSDYEMTRQGWFWETDRRGLNDTLGHPAGDELLKQVAQRLQSVCDKAYDIGRLGGDEFQVILPDLEDRGKLGELAKRIISIVSQPYSIEGSRCVIGASIGIAIAPFDGLTSEDLIRSTDLALYAAKGGGRGQFRFYSSELHESAAVWKRTCAMRWSTSRSHCITSRLFRQPPIR